MDRQEIVIFLGCGRKKTCLWGFCQRETQTSLLSYRDQLENKIFTCSKSIYDHFQKANNKVAYQTTGDAQANGAG